MAETISWDCSPEQPRVRWVVRNGERVLQHHVGVVSVEIVGDERKVHRQNDEWRDVPVIHET